MEFSEPLNYFK